MKKTIAIILTLILAFSMLSACGKKESESKELTVYNWGEYIDEDTISDFENETGIKVNYKTYETNEQLYSVLRQGGVSYDVIIPSDYMIGRLIAEDMLEKINYDNIPNYSLVLEEYKNLAFDPENEYSVPYMTGTVGLIYNSAIIDEEITSWGALFDEQYSGQILMFDNSRDAFGIALKYLGYSLNTTNEDELQEAYELLKTQAPILQAYVMDQILEKLESGEAAIGPYYSGDYITMLENNPDLKFVIPTEGTNRFVDSFCIPKGAPNKENAEKFINYMCGIEVSLGNSDYIGYTSPIDGVRDLQELDEESESVMYPSVEVLERCEVFVNLPENILKLYDDLWIKLKS